MNFIYLLGLASLMFCFACSNPSSMSRIGSTRDSNFYQGDLRQALDLQYANPNGNLSPYCDNLIKDKKYEILDALKNHEALIKSYVPDQKKLGLSNMRQMGQFEVYSAKPLITENKWIQDKPYGWPLVIQDYEWAKKENTLNAWTYLNAQVRNVVLDDNNRILNVVNLSITHEDLANMTLLKKAIDDCVSSQCQALNISSDLLQWANSKWFYKWRFEHIKDNDNFTKNLLSFQKRVNSDYEYFDSIRNPLIKVQGPDTLIIPYNQTLITPNQNVFAQITSEAWSQFGLKVKIDWAEEKAVDLQIVPTGFRGEFAYSGENMKIEIGQSFVDKTLTHEFGHSLGLPDKYFTTFDETNCLYTSEYNPSEIMSDSSNGTVQKADIDQIATTYDLSLKSAAQ